MARARVTVSGRVQGVWFRGATRERARQLDLTGWVRNLPDGRVEAVFEGDEQSLERALEFVRQGPPGAQVASVELAPSEPQEGFASFEIRR